MTSLELEAKKTALIRAILDMDDDKVNLLDEVIHQINTPMPCVMSDEQLREQIKQGMKDQEAGLGCSGEELMNQFKKRLPA